MKRLLLLFSLIFPYSALADECVQYSNQPPFHIAKIDLNCPNIQLIGSEKSDNGTTVSDFAQKYQTNIAINANFYWKDHTPIGLVVSNGKRWSKYGDTRSRVIFACDKANKCLIEDKNKATPLNKKWQLVIAGWHFYNAKTGKFECAEVDKVGCNQDIFDGKHPRTMLGLDEKNNQLYLVVVEGRQLLNRGISLNELAYLAKNLGVTRAINLDGGGSSTMVVGNKRVNSLPILQSEERKVANHFGVKLK